MKKFSFSLELKDVSTSVMDMLFGPEFYKMQMAPQIEEWENEGGAVR